MSESVKYDAQNPKEKLELEILDKGNVSRHSHQRIECLFLLSGELDVQVEQETFSMLSEDILVINANRFHSFHAEGSVLYMKLSIQWQLVSDIILKNDVLIRCTPEQREEKSYYELQSVLKKMLINYIKNERTTNNFKHISLCYQVLDILTSNYLVSSSRWMGEESVPDVYGERITRINQYIRENYRNQISLSEVAGQMHLSAAYLSKFFKKYYGMNFSKFVEDTRLYYATEELLFSNKSISRIVIDNGFPDIAAFERAFKRRNGMNPSDKRKSVSFQRGQEFAVGQNEEHTREIDRKLQRYMKEEESQHHPMPELNCVLDIDTREAGQPLQAAWADTINIGVAYDLLSAKIQEHICLLKDRLHFRYIRFWNIFTEDMLLSKSGMDGTYNYSRLDAVLDFLLKNDLIPHLELTNKPNRIMKNVRHNMARVNESGVLNENRQPSLELLNDLMSHLSGRYGSRINEWRFELWFPEDQWNLPEKRDEFIEMFGNAYHIIRRYNAFAKIGGFGLRTNVTSSEVMDFFRRWSVRQKPDFLSAIFFSYEEGVQNEDAFFRRNTANDSMKDFIKDYKDSMQKNNMGNIPLYVTEWNLTISERNWINDSVFKGAYIIRNMIRLYGDAQKYVYFHGTDLTSEHYDSGRLLFGGNGLLSRDGITKPSALAFILLNRLFPCYVMKNENALVSRDENGQFGIICHNQKPLGSVYYLTDEDCLNPEELWKYFDDSDRLHITIRINDVASKYYRVRVFRVNEDNGSVFNFWEKLDFDSELSGNDILYLSSRSSPSLRIRREEVKKGKLELSFNLEPNEFDFIEIRPEKK